MEEDEQPSLRKGGGIGGSTGFPKHLAISVKAFHVRALPWLPCETPRGGVLQWGPLGPQVIWGQEWQPHRSCTLQRWGELCAGPHCCRGSGSPNCKDFPGPGAVEIGVACAVEGPPQAFGQSPSQSLSPADRSLDWRLLCRWRRGHPPAQDSPPWIAFRFTPCQLCALSILLQTQGVLWILQNSAL